MTFDANVKNFYTGKCVFITGGTGFLGKVIIEKLLRSCPGIDRIYLLIRQKDDKDVNTRIKNMFNSQLFTCKILSEKPELCKKIIGIQGDIMLPGLGLSLSDQELLLNDVAVVIHSAASIKFNDPLKFAVDVNIRGTKKVVDLCKMMTKLKVLIHLSTAFSFCDQSLIEEKIYEVNIEPKKILSLTEWMQDDLLESVATGIIGTKLTTYHLTKSIAEKLLEDEAKNLPIAIVRPSVVGSTWKEPVPGWTESLYHINGIMVATGRGVMRVLPCTPEKVLDTVPADMVANLTITAAWDRATNVSASESNNLKIYNFVTGIQNPLTYGKLRDYLIPISRKYPLLLPACYPALTLVKSHLVAFILNFVMLWIPGFIVDSLIHLVGMKPVLLPVAKKIQRSHDFNKPFLNNDYRFTNDNVQALQKKLSTAERDEFFFDVSAISWPDYLKDYFLGCKQYVCKEDLSTLTTARFHMKIMKTLYYSSILLFSGFFILGLYLVLR